MSYTSSVRSESPNPSTNDGTCGLFLSYHNTQRAFLRRLPEICNGAVIGEFAPRFI